MNDSIDSNFDSAGVSIRFKDEGEGVPVVLIHGFTGTAEMWRRVGIIEDLTKQFRVIALDCRGHGQSGKPHDPSAYGLQMVADVIGLMDELEIPLAHIVGYSMGAEIALRLTVDHQSRVLSLVIGGSGWSGELDAADYTRMGDSLGNSGSFGALMRSRTPANKPAPTAVMIAARDQILKVNDVQALAAVARAMGDIVGLPETQISAINVPVLAIAGENDPELGNLEKMVGVVPDIKMKVLPGKDHMQAVSDPEFKDSIVKFLSAPR